MARAHPAEPEMVAVSEPVRAKPDLIVAAAEIVSSRDLDTILAAFAAATPVSEEASRALVLRIKWLLYVGGIIATLLGLFLIATSLGTTRRTGTARTVTVSVRTSARPSPGG